MKRLTLLFACMALAVLSNSAVAAENELLELVRHEADVEKVYSAISRAEWSDANLSVVSNLWREGPAKHAKVPRSADENDLIRLALTNVLMQTTRQCVSRGIAMIAMKELHDFVLSRTKSNSPSVRGRATFLIGLAGFDSDIPFLVSMVESEKEGYAEQAVVGITYIHSKAGLDALRSLEKKVTRPALRTFIHERLEQYEAYPLNEPFKECANKKPGSTRKAR